MKGEVGGGSEASGRYSEPGYLDLPLRAFLGLLADDQPAPAGGAAAALGVALAASLCAMAARLSGRQLPEAAELAAEAGARSACALVRINLSAAESDERLARVARLLAAMPSAGAAP